MAVVFILFIHSYSAYAQSDGESLYKATCAACHTINGGRLVGPDLAGIHEIREQEWLLRFIRSSQKMIKEGDSLAVSLYEAYNRIPMPDNNFSDREILSIIDYIREIDSGIDKKTGQAITGQAITPDSSVSRSAASYPSDLLRDGKSLFYGHTQFKNGPSPCSACHGLQDGSTISGGRLGIDLTDSWERLGRAGIQAIISNPPFPTMKAAYSDIEITADEKEAVTAFLHFLNDRHTGAPKNLSDGPVFLMLGFVLAIVIVVHIYILYDNRKIPFKKRIVDK